MYNVSDAYKAAIEKPSRQFELGGEIRLKSGDVIPITDDIVWNKGDVVVDSFAMSSDNETDIGACCTAVLTMSIIDNNKNHLYADAEISLICSLILENGEKEPIPMGTFYVGANTAERTGSKFEITAYDAMIKLHYLLTDDMRAALKGCTAYQAAAYLFEDGMAQNEEIVTAFPNGNLKLDFSAESIETARDAVMWCGHLMGCFTRISRLGKLEFVKLTPRNIVEHEASFGIIPERWISPNQRFKTKFSDKRMQIFTLVMRDNDKKPIVYSAAPSFDSQNTIISFEIEQNPLILGQTACPIYYVLKNILDPIHRMVMQPFTSEIANDPALEAGDYIAIQEGGDNDRGTFSSMITHNIWRYRGHHEIHSGASMQVVEFDQPIAASFSARVSEGSKTYVQPISQAEKASRNTGGSAETDRLVYTPPWGGAKTELVYDGNSNSVSFRDTGEKEIGKIRFFDNQILITGENTGGFAPQISLLSGSIEMETRAIKATIDNYGRAKIQFKANASGYEDSYPPIEIISSQYDGGLSSIKFGGHKLEAKYNSYSGEPPELKFNGRKFKFE